MAEEPKKVVEAERRAAVSGCSVLSTITPQDNPMLDFTCFSQNMSALIIELCRRAGPSMWPKVNGATSWEDTCLCLQGGGEHNELAFERRVRGRGPSDPFMDSLKLESCGAVPLTLS